MTSVCNRPLVVVIAEIPTTRDHDVDLIAFRDALRSALVVLRRVARVQVLVGTDDGVAQFCKSFLLTSENSAPGYVEIALLDELVETPSDVPVIVLGGGKRTLELLQNRQCVPVASTGGAALQIWYRQYGNNTVDSWAFLLYDELVYDHLFQMIVERFLPGTKG